MRICVYLYLHRPIPQTMITQTIIMSKKLFYEVPLAVEVDLLQMNPICTSGSLEGFSSTDEDFDAFVSF